MSRRFGRNQRRRAREALAAAQQEVAQANARAENAFHSAAQDRRDARAALRYIADALGPHFAGLPAQETDRTYDDERDRMQMPMHDAIALAFSPDATAETLAYTTMLMDLLTVDSVADDLRQRVHFYLRKNGEKKVAYALSATTLAGQPRARIVQMLTQALATVVAEEFDTTKKGRLRP